MQRHIKDTIGFEVDQCLNVVRCQHANRAIEPNEISDVTANLLSTECVGAYEFEIWSLENRLNGVAGYRTRRPLNNPCASHPSLLSSPVHRTNRASAKLYALQTRMTILFYKHR